MRIFRIIHPGVFTIIHPPPVVVSRFSNPVSSLVASPYESPVVVFVFAPVFLGAAAPVVTVDKPSTLDRSAYPSNCGKKQRSVLLFSIVAAVSTGAHRLECFGLVFHKLLSARFPALDFLIFLKVRFVSDKTRHQ